MRVAIITENFLPKVDGVTRTLARLLEHLQDNGHEALVLGPESGMTHYAGAELVGTSGIPLLVYPDLYLNFWRPKFTRKLVEFKPDVIHFVDPVWLGAAGMAWCWLACPTVPMLSSYHTNLAAYAGHFGFSFLTDFLWAWSRYVHGKCNLTFCPSKSTSDMLRSQAFDNLRIWPRGVDISLFGPHRRSDATRTSWLAGLPGEEHRTVILYVGRVSFEKNLGLVVEAYKKMDHGGCHLVIVGHGPAYDEIKADLAAAGVPVTFTGYLQGEELATAYASADLFAFPSYTETFGQVVLEAMASGLPVIGLNAEGVCDLVTDEETGLLLNVGDLNRFQQYDAYRFCLERVVADQELRAQMGVRAVDAAQKFTWHEAMECLVRGYQELLARKKRLDRRRAKNGGVLPVGDEGDSGVEEDIEDEEDDNGGENGDEDEEGLNYGEDIDERSVKSKLSVIEEEES